MGGSENIINTNKWGWDGQLELSISNNKFVKWIVKTSTKHNNIFLKYAITQSFQGKPITNKELQYDKYFRSEKFFAIVRKKLKKLISVPLLLSTPE